MPYTYTELGQDHFADAGFGLTDDYINTIAVGTGTTNPSVTDTELESEVFEATDSISAVSFEPGNDPGEYICRISLQGGTEVPGKTDITELGLKTASGDLLYRETRTAVTVDTGSRVVFEFDVNITNV